MADSVNEMLATIRAAMAGNAEQVPVGFLTAEEWGEKWSISRGHTQRLIREGIKAGVMIKQDFRIQTGRGIYPTPHYGPA